MGETGYEDLDKLYSDQRQSLHDAQNLQEEIIDSQTTQQVDTLNRQREEYQKQAEKEAKGLYSNYQKEASPYSVGAELRAENGLNNSGYAESSQVNLYNKYQENVTEIMNTANKLKADVDFEINNAYKDADIQKAQTQLQMYQQQVELALQMYEFKQARDQFEWQKDSWQEEFNWQKDSWQQEFDWNKNAWQQEMDWNRSTWQQEMDYQRQRDAISDSQWERQYQLSLKNASNKASSKNVRASSYGGGDTKVGMSKKAESLLNSLVNDENISTFDAVAKVASNRSKGIISKEDEALILSNLGLY